MSGWFDIWHNADWRTGHGPRRRVRPGGGSHLVRHRITRPQITAQTLSLRGDENALRRGIESRQGLGGPQGPSPRNSPEVLTEKADAVDRVISELALTGNYQTADLAIAYAYQQSVQLGEWVRQVEVDNGFADRIDKWLDNMPEQQRAALRKYENAAVDRRDVVRAARRELGLYVPLWSRYRRVLRGAISNRAVTPDLT